MGARAEECFLTHCAIAGHIYIYLYNIYIYIYIYVFHRCRFRYRFLDHRWMGKIRLH